MLSSTKTNTSINRTTVTDPARCPCCSGTVFSQTDVLWDALIDAWELSASETIYINRQQGFRCKSCNSNLRTMALASAIMNTYGYRGVFAKFVRSWRSRRISFLEINEAGNLTPFLFRLRRHLLVRFPDVDMQALPFDDASFDAVVHSDTLEHVPDPNKGLAECWRVLRPGGFCFYTVPIVVGRMTKSTEGQPASYHGSPRNPDDYRVFTEYGPDVWIQAASVGFRNIQLHQFEFPSGIAIVCQK